MPPTGVLIAGTSHVGKTTLAKLLADALGCNAVSTDSLGRHPGRPWPDVRPQVAEFYRSLSTETTHWFLKVHHENMWPALQRRIEDEVRAQKPFVLEGSALRPEFIASLVGDPVAGIVLHADADFLRDRMRSEAGYAQANDEMRMLVDAFIERSLRDNDEIRIAAEAHGLALVDAADPGAVDGIFEETLLKAQRAVDSRPLLQGYRLDQASSEAMSMTKR